MEGANLTDLGTTSIVVQSLSVSLAFNIFKVIINLLPFFSKENSKLKMNPLLWALLLLLAITGKSTYRVTLSLLNLAGCE